MPLNVCVQAIAGLLQKCAATIHSLDVTAAPNCSPVKRRSPSSSAALIRVFRLRSSLIRLGDLFVIRVAGNIIAPSLVGSVEFAAEQFGTRLVVVLGHTNCGAVTATLDELERPSGSRSPNLRSIVDRIRPTVEELRHTDLWHDRPTLLHYAVRANIRASASQLRHGSQILEHLIAHEGLLIVGAEYSLETGLVDFFDENGRS